MSAFKDHFFQTQDGLRLYARDYTGPDDNAPVVLCLHGLTRNSRDFQELTPALADHFRVLVPEQRGRGRAGQIMTTTCRVTRYCNTSKTCAAC